MQDISGKEIYCNLLISEVSMNYNHVYQKLGRRIEKLRREKNMTQEVLAEKSGLHRAYFWDIENGRNISVKTSYKIARALQVSLSELFDF